ncbi:MAG: hypothetical protein WCI03_04145 [bacterium]
MDTFIDIIGKVGGILAFMAATLGFIFREYIKARVTDVFAKRIEKRRHAREDAFLLSEVIAHTRGAVVEKLVDARLKAIEKMAERASLLSESATSLHSSRGVADKFGPPGEKQYNEAILASNAAYDSFSHIIACSIPHLPESVVDRAREFQSKAIALIKKFADASQPHAPTDFSEMWSAEHALHEALKTALLSTINMPETIATQHTGKFTVGVG